MFINSLVTFSPVIRMSSSELGKFCLYLGLIQQTLALITC